MLTSVPLTGLKKKPDFKRTTDELVNENNLGVVHYKLSYTQA